jgi:hypothetical protein
MDSEVVKADLHHYLQAGRESLVWKLDGLSEYDVRRPMTRTGTNLLGIVKHVASVEAWYLGDVFGRRFGVSLPWFDDDAETNADMWATSDETRADVVGLYHRAWASSDATVRALDLDAVGEVPWWPANRRRVTLHHMLVRMVEETNRHAGHADIVRELIDGTVGLQSGKADLPALDDAAWQAHSDRLERVAREAQQRSMAD